VNRPDDFNGPLAAEMTDFIVHKRMQGYTYRSQVESLRLFDRFITGRNHPGGVLQGDVFELYQASIAELAPGTREGYLSVVRVFSQYLHALRPESAVMPANMQPRHARAMRFHRIAPERIRELMEAAHDLRMHHPLGPCAVSFLIGLLYSMGLRISKALKLSIATRGATS